MSPWDGGFTRLLDTALDEIDRRVTAVLNISCCESPESHALCFQLAFRSLYLGRVIAEAQLDAIAEARLAGVQAVLSGAQSLAPVPPQNEPVGHLPSASGPSETCYNANQYGSSKETLGTADPTGPAEDCGRWTDCGPEGANRRGDAQATETGVEEAKLDRKRLEVFKDRLQVTPQVTQPPHYLDIRKGSIAERYCKGRLDLVAELHVSWHGQACDYLAILHAYEADKIGQIESNFAVPDNERFDSGVRQNGNEQPMLVRVVEDTEPVERVVSSLVRFHLPYEINGPRIGAIYVSLSNGCLKGIRTICEGELNGGIVLAVRNESGGEMIQRGAQIMYDISDDRREMLRNLLANANRDAHKGAWLSVMLKDKAIRFSIREVPDFSVEVGDVLLGPC